MLGSFTNVGALLRLRMPVAAVPTAAPARAFAARRRPVSVWPRRLTGEARKEFELETPKNRYDCIALIEDLLDGSDVLLFMKGSPEEPKCGHSKRLVALLESAGLRKFTAVDVLQSQVLRETIKEMSACPTIPQLFINKKFVGGADEVQAMITDGSFRKLLEDEQLLISNDQQ